MNTIRNPITAKIVSFLGAIGLQVEADEIEGKTFVPGIQINHGRLLFDEAHLTYPGDLLHEAGHLAVVPPKQRSERHIDAGSDPAEEMMAIAWSYAAAIDLDLDPAIVFHAGGYRGGSDSILENFKQGRYIAVPMLQWIGLTVESKKAEALGVPPYPHMLRWLRED